jgi:OOP family OmpA-OmpF porin
VKTIQCLAVASIVSLFAVSAHAGDWYVVGSVGQSKQKAISKDDTDSALMNDGVTGLSSTMDDRGTGYKLQLGYQFAPHFALEGGYVDLGKSTYKATGTLNGTAVAGNGEFKASGFNLDAVVIAPVNDQFAVFAKLGGIEAKARETESASFVGISGFNSASSTDSKYNFGVGASYSFSKNLGVRAEFERFSSVGNDSKMASGDIDLLSVGVVVKY